MTKQDGIARCAIAVTTLVMVAACDSAADEVADAALAPRPDASSAVITDADVETPEEQRLACLNGADFGAIEAILDEAAAQRGVGFAVATAGGVVLEYVGGGLSKTDVVPIASSSKMPSTVAILGLVDEGILALDEPVGTYLPAWPADKQGITLRMLLAQTSGLRGNAGCLADTATTLQACATEIAALPLAQSEDGEAYGPGEAFVYGGTNLQVAAAIAETAAGQPFADLVRARYALACDAPSFGYGDTDNPRAAGGASVALLDYVRLMQMHLRNGRCGTRVLSEDLVAAMQLDQTGGAVIESSPYDDGRRYGFSWWLSPAGQEADEISDQGAFGATPWIDRDYGFAAFILVRHRLGTGTAIWNQVREPLRAIFASCSN